MFYKWTIDCEGDYITPSGARGILTEARNVRPTAGWTRFTSRDECIAAWGIRPLEPGNKNQTQDNQILSEVKNS